LVDVNFLAQRFHKTQAREMIEREVPIKPAQEIGTQEKVSFFKRILQKIT